MPSFLRVFRRDADAKAKKNALAAAAAEPPKPKWEEAWSLKEVQPEEVQELIRVCTQEMKSRALEMPFLLLPFRPGLDTLGSKNFVRQYFRARYEGHVDPKAFARRELMLMEPIVLCSIMKWCWARLPGGVVSWETYHLFRAAEVDSKMAKNAFDVFIPMSTDSEARKEIIFDFFDLLAAVAARGKTNGLGGRKLSRYAGWWAFEHSDNGKGFDGGYKSWTKAADATSHLFFAYLRALSPNPESSASGISKLPRSLQALLSQTEYPPETPSLMQSTTSKVIMIVDVVSPTPFALLRRARHFEYRDDDIALIRFSAYDDPVRALSDECKRVLEAISQTNQSLAVSNGSGIPTASWSRFEDLGFSSLADSLTNPGDLAGPNGGGNGSSLHINLARPTTPSWADFLSSGFPDDRGPTLLPPDKQLPLPVHPQRVHSSQSHRPGGTQADLDPGELASITHFDLDQTFWWVWMTSLAAEEPSERKAVFGRCALIETEIPGAPWLLIEEQVKGASPDQEDGVYLAEKKSRFSFTRRGRMGKRKTATKKKDKLVEEPQEDKLAVKVAPEKQAKIQEAAALLARGKQPKGTENLAQRHSRIGMDDAKSNTMLAWANEAGPALTWANHFDSGALKDKDDIRTAYLNDKTAGTGRALQSTSAANLSNGHTAVQHQGPAKNDDDEIAKAVFKAQTPPATPPKAEKAVIGDDKPSVDDHPAFRPSPPAKQAASPVLPRPKPSPKQDHKKLQKPKAPREGGFKNLFARKKSTRELEEKPRPKISAPVPVVEPAYDSPPRSPPMEAVQEPTLSEPAYEAPVVSERDEARQAKLERLEADREFSKFDQGPLEDVPAFVGDDDAYDEEPAVTAAAPPPPAPAPEPKPEPPRQLQLPRAINKPAPLPISARPNHMPLDAHPAVQARLAEAKKVEAPAEKKAATPAAAEAVTPSDRWAQIRKNAAERARRMNEDHQRHDRKQSQGRSDDGETSGEETIESRVARIKARVAELTGNMDTAQSRP